MPQKLPRSPYHGDDADRLRQTLDEFCKANGTVMIAGVWLILDAGRKWQPIAMVADSVMFSKEKADALKQIGDELRQKIDEWCNVFHAS